MCWWDVRPCSINQTHSHRDTIVEIFCMLSIRGCTECTGWLQRVHICLRPDWVRQNVHHGRTRSVVCRQRRRWNDSTSSNTSVWDGCSIDGQRMEGEVISTCNFYLLFVLRFKSLSEINGRKVRIGYVVSAGQCLERQPSTKNLAPFPPNFQRSNQLILVSSWTVLPAWIYEVSVDCVARLV